MTEVIISGVISFMVTFYAIPVILRVAEEKKLYDIPDERKIHKKLIPSLGGIGLFAGFAISLLFAVNMGANPNFQYYVLAFLIIFFIGLKDDLVVISPMKKFMGQLIAAGILIFKAGVLIKSMHGFLGIYELNDTASHILTFFTMIVVINAFNLIDGIDGLAGSIAFISSSVFGIYFLVNGEYGHAALGIALAASIAAFLIYNFHPAKIFMGDTGSMLLGVVNVILVIQFIEMGPTLNYPIEASPAIGFGILLIPLMDTLRVFGIRILHRRSPFSPDRNHLHHLLLDKGLSHKQITLSITAASVLYSGFVFLAQPLGCTLLISSMVVIFFGSVLLLFYTKPKKQMRVVRKPDDLLVSPASSTPIVKVLKVVEGQEASAIAED